MPKCPLPKPEGAGLKPPGTGEGEGVEAHPAIRLASPSVASAPRPATPFPVNDRLEPSTGGREGLGASRSITSGEHLHRTVEAHQAELDFEAGVTLVHLLAEGQ